MWYGVVDGEIWLETKAKSQKAVNLRRDPRITFLLEAGDTYDTLRGVSFEGTAEIVDDPGCDLPRRRQCVGALYRPLHRRGQAGGGHDDEQADRDSIGGQAHSILGPPQAGHAADAAGGLDRAFCLTR